MAFLGYALMASNSPEEKEKDLRRRAIELCWKDQGRKSLDPSVQRFVAGACERMEAEFQERFHASP